MIFQKDMEEIKKSDIVVFVMDGRVPDEGACVGIGLGYAYNKECIGLKTDSRSLMDGMDTRDESRIRNKIHISRLGG